MPKELIQSEETRWYPYPCNTEKDLMSREVDDFHKAMQKVYEQEYEPKSSKSHNYKTCLLLPEEKES